MATLLMNLTREQILSEPAGARMDAWIAENVMGYDLTGKTQELPIRWVGVPDPYSTDIAVAWEVVKEMQRQDWWFYCGVLPSYVYAIFSKDRSPREERAEARIDEMPLAICRAARLAKFEQDTEHSLRPR